MRFAKLALLLSTILFAVSCSPVDALSNGLNVVTSSQILGDVLGAIAGDLAQITILIPAGTDPHSYEPSPRDAIILEEADLIFINGFGLEETLQPLLDEQNAKVVDISIGIEPLSSVEEDEPGPDPHVWMNPLNVKTWVDNISAELAEIDSANASIYQTNAEAYKTQLEDLDAWAADQIAQIPVENRILVTDHESFTYFADHYGFEIIGAAIPGYSTLSEPSAGELADLESSIQDFGVRAIFVGVSLTQVIAERVAEDTGILLVPLYTESLSDANGPAPTYLDMIRYDVDAITNALK
jgi:ABC-type Zn uptake system ZnuABC Zn-binding protein ZnuA